MASSVEIAIIVASSLSAGASCTVVVTFLTFFKHFRNKRFIQIIFWIALSEMIAGVASAFGFPSSDSVLCPTQAFLVFYFVKASWAWTTLLTFQIYRLVCHGDLSLNIYYMHAFVWLICLFLTLIPLSDTQLGSDSKLSGSGWCYLNASPDNYFFWSSFTFVGIFFCCIFLMLYFLIRIYWHLSDGLPTTAVVLKAIDSLKLYPIALIVIWVPAMALVTALFAGQPVQQAFSSCLVLATQNGTITTIIFFTKSTEARWRWKSLFCMTTSAPPPFDIPETDRFIDPDTFSKSSTDAELLRDDSESSENRGSLLSLMRVLSRSEEK